MANQPKNPSSDVSRRTFMKTSAAAAGAVMASQMPLQASAFYGVDDTIKVGLIGCGGRGTGAAVQALSTNQNVKLVAMADAFRDRLDDCYNNITNGENWAEGMENRANDRIDVPEEHKFVGFDGYKQVIELADVIILTTPPGFRPMHFEAAVMAGKHVFTEKPMATDAAGIRKVLEVAKIAKEKQLNVVVGLQRHYQTIYREWVKRIHDGMIGDVVLSRVYWNSDGVWVRDRASLEAKAGRKITEMEYQMRNWYYFNWLCGDHITEQHIHNLDVGNWVKQGYPVKAQGQGGRQVRNGPDHGEIYDHHMVEFEYADGSRMLSQCRHIQGCNRSVTEGFHGTNGTAPKPGVIVSSRGHTLFDHDASNDINPYQQEHNELFAAIAKGKYKFADTVNGAKSTLTSIMGRMATYTGQEITWDQALNADENLLPAKFAWDADPPVMPDAHGRYRIPMPGGTM